VTERASSWTQLVLLLRVHFRILKRLATATRGRRVVSTLLIVLGAVASFLLAVTGGVAMIAGRARLGMSPVELDEGLHLAFAAVYLVIVLSPIFGFRGSEFMDVTRLFHLPITHRTVFSASAVGIVFSGGILFWLPPLWAIAAGYSWKNGAAVVPRLLIVLVFLLHAVAFGQVMVLALLNFLRSRRFRDMGLVLAPLFAGSLWLVAWGALARGRQAGGGGILRRLLGMHLSTWFPFLPSRWATDAMVAVGQGDLVGWLPFLLGFLPLTFLLFRIAAVLQERAFLGEVPPEETAGARRRRIFPGTSWLKRWLPDEVLAIASKEWRLLSREPVVKTVLIGQSGFLLMPVLVLALRPSAQGDAVARVATYAWVFPYALVFVQNTLTMNLLGLEGAGVLHLRTLPSRWRSILAGKNLCYLLGFGAANALVTTAALLFVRAVRPSFMESPLRTVLLAVLGGTCALAIVLAVGNVLSVSMPSPLTVRGRMALRQQASLSEGCYEKLARLAIFAGTVILVVPVPLALLVLPHFAPGFFDSPWWLALASVLCPLYAGALLKASWPMAEEVAGNGEEMIVRRMVRSSE
jgi:hypothetical protein